MTEFMSTAPNLLSCCSHGYKMTDFMSKALNLPTAPLLQEEQEERETKMDRLHELSTQSAYCTSPTRRARRERDQDDKLYELATCSEMMLGSIAHGTRIQTIDQVG